MASSLLQKHQGSGAPCGRGRQSDSTTRTEKPMELDSTQPTAEAVISDSDRQLSISNQNRAGYSAEDTLKTIDKPPIQSSTETVEADKQIETDMQIETVETDKQVEAVKQIEMVESDKQVGTDKQVETDKQSETDKQVKTVEADKQGISEISSVQREETVDTDRQAETSKPHDNQVEADKQAGKTDIPTELVADMIQGSSDAKKPRIDHETIQDTRTSTAGVDKKNLESLSQNSSNKDVDTGNETSITSSTDTKRSSKDPNTSVDEGKDEKRSRKRKLPDELEQAQDNTPKSVSTYDRVRLIIQPWRKPEGGINKPIFKMMLESVMLFFMMHPGSTEKSLVGRYKPYLQPMVLRNLVQILIDLGCLNAQYLKKPTVSLFSTYCPEEACLSVTDTPDDQNIETFYVPTEECLIRLGQFGRELFPHAKWPESTLQN